MAILSVDQSYTSSGLVILDDEGGLLSAELYKSDSEQDIFARAWAIAEHVAELADKCHARFVSIEGLAYAKVGDATRDLAGLQFVLATTLRFTHGYHVEVIYPSTAKKLATGKGNSKKEELVEYLPKDVLTFFKEHVGAKKTTGLLDLTDAYWIGRAALDQIPTDYVSKHPDDPSVDHTIKEACKKLEEETGYEARVNPDTLIVELLVDGEWIQIQVAE